MYGSLTDENYFFRGSYIFARDTLKICINRVKHGSPDMYGLRTPLEPKNENLTIAHPTDE